MLTTAQRRIKRNDGPATPDDSGIKLPVDQRETVITELEGGTRHIQFVDPPLHEKRPEVRPVREEVEEAQPVAERSARPDEKPEDANLGYDWHGRATKGRQ